MTDYTEQQLFEARRARFIAKAQMGGYASQLSGATVKNDGKNHESEVIRKRSKRNIDRVLSGIIAASLQIGRHKTT